MYYYIINPAAGGGTIDNLQDKLKSTLHQLKIDGEFAKTLGEGDAAHIARRAVGRGIKTIVAVGGDDTVHEIIETLHKGKHYQVALGIIPIGKQNTLAAHLGLTSWRQACDVLSVRRISEYRLMECNEDVFIYSCRFVPKLVSEHNQDLTAKDQPAAAHNIDYNVQVDERFRLKGQASEVSVYNQKFLNSELENQLLMRIATPDEPEKSRWFSKILSMKRTPAVLQPTVSQLHAENLKLHFASGVTAELDGQPVEGKQFQLRLGEQSLRLITAREAAESRMQANATIDQPR